MSTLPWWKSQRRYLANGQTRLRLVYQEASREWRRIDTILSHESKMMRINSVDSQARQVVCELDNA
jgi:hypothetical protein